MATRVWYLATPYSSTDPAIVQARYNDALRVGHALIKAGFVLIQPIAQSHDMCNRYDMPGDFAFWERHCKALIDRCDGIIVAQIFGWRESKGVQSEILYAKEKGKEVLYVGVDGKFIEQGFIGWITNQLK